MSLFKTIDHLFIGTKLLTWGIGVVGMVASIVLFFANISLGISSAAVFIATFFLANAVSLLLLPNVLSKGILASKKKYIVGSIALIASLAIITIVYFSNINLLFA